MTPGASGHAGAPPLALAAYLKRLVWLSLLPLLLLAALLEVTLTPRVVEFVLTL